MRLNAKQIAQFTGAEFLVNPIDPSQIITDITWDSREVVPDSLFVALPGEHVDGHAFVRDALTKGATGILVSEPISEAESVLARELGASVMSVSNTSHAITDLAKGWRSHLRGRVIAVTGSTGKTTTKNLIRDIASTRFSVVATKGNQNNELGAPRTLLAADPDTEVIVLEMGMDGVGQIRALCDMARPDWGVITNVGDSHIERLGSREAIADAKAELLEGLPNGVGKAFLNANDDFTEYMSDHAALIERGIDIYRYAQSGCKEDARADDKGFVFARDVSLDDEGNPVFTLCVQGFVDEAQELIPTLFDMEPDLKCTECHLRLGGIHNVSNATAAAAVGLALGIDLETVVSALGKALPEAGRLERIVSRVGYTIINDTYNASPDSMRASLSTLASMDVAGLRYAVLGDMGELGDIAEACHVGVGACVAELGIDRLVCVGEMSEHIKDGAIASGMDAAHVLHVKSIADALEALEGVLEPADCVLVKASRFMELNRLSEGLAS